MKQEEWCRWEPTLDLACQYWVESISDNEKSFEVILHEHPNFNNKAHILFSNKIVTYRHTNESYIGKFFDKLHNKYGSNSCNKWTFFTVADSEYLRWLSQLSNGAEDTKFLTHFVLLTFDSALEIISDTYPTVKIFRKMPI